MVHTLLKIRIWHHKWMARGIASNIIDLRNKYNCGNGMIDSITGGRLTLLNDKLKERLAILIKLDPNCTHH